MHREEERRDGPRRRIVVIHHANDLLFPMVGLNGARHQGLSTMYMYFRIRGIGSCMVCCLLLSAVGILPPLETP